MAKAENKKICLAVPKTGQDGIYAREYLPKGGLWEGVREKVVPTESVRAALAAVESGNVEAGIIYKTDSLISKKVKIAVEISAAEGPKISYPIAVVKSSTEPQRARKFAEYLAGPAARQVFEKFRFIIARKGIAMTGEACRIVFFTIKVSAFSTHLVLPPGIAIA